MMTDENQQIIGVQQSNSSLIDFTVNQKGQIVESYWDNGGGGVISVALSKSIFFLVVSCCE